MGGTPERDGEDATAGVDVQPEIRFRCDLVNIALSLIMGGALDVHLYVAETQISVHFEVLPTAASSSRAEYGLLGGSAARGRQPGESNLSIGATFHHPRNKGRNR